MGELHISQNMDHVSPDCFSSKELTNMCIQIVIKGEDQLFHNISKMDINQDFAQKYLEYLVTLIHLNKPIDFIQAALVMQTLSSVFAKKVDHLQEQILAFTIVFRKLELGSNNVEDENGENNDGQERGKANKKKNIEKEIIMHAFENVCLSNNIRKNCIKKWSDKDIKKVDPYALRNKINECPKIKTKELFSCYIYDNKLDKLGKKEEFGVNGFLCNNLIPKDDFCLSCTHTQDLWKLNDTVNLSVFPMEAEQPRSHDDCMNIDNAVSPIHNVNEHSYQDVVEEFINNSLNDKDDSISGHVYFEKINQVQERLVDVGGIYNILWSPVGDNNKQLERKIKKRNVKSIPEDIKKEINDTKDFRSPYPSEYVLSDLMLAIFKLKSNVPLHPHFTNSLRLEKERRAKHISRKNGKRVKGAVTNLKNGDFKGFNEFGDDNVDNNLFEHELDVACGDDYNITEDNSFCNNDNYMQDAIQHIREYQQGIQHNQHEDTINEIALKVSAWHDSIRPHLEREEGRTNFDIHEYGSKILQQFPQSNAKTTLRFADCIQNQPREEIPRYFLSSLLLANSYNIEISKSNPDELSVNDMMLTLLSRVRQHELLDEGMRKEFS